MRSRLDDILQRLKHLANPENVAGMARFGINPKGTYGVSIPTLRAIAKESGVDHNLARNLWQSGVHEARILASMIDDPAEVSAKQMDGWASDFDSWDVCDQVCSNLFDKTSHAYSKVVEWSAREEEYVKRAAFALMAALSVHDKKAPDDAFERFLPIIREQASDNRNYVRKAVSWALRSIGKRNILLNHKATAVATVLKKSNAKSSRWVGSDAHRELTSDKVRRKLASRR